MRYIQSFSTSGDVQTAIDNGSLGKPYVAYVESDGAIDWNTKEKTDYSKKYLTFEIVSGGTLVIEKNDNDLYYSKNDADFIQLTNSYNELPLNEGDIIRFYGNNNTFNNNYNAVFRTKFQTNLHYNVYGNIMSLLYGQNFIGKTSFDYNEVFMYLFFKNKIISAKNLILPATTLTNYCYVGMFQGCSKLIEGPEILATTLATSSCNTMFSDCSKLNHIKCMVTGTNYSNTYNWVSGVQTNSGTFVKKVGVTWPTGNSGIPNNWTVIEE